MVEVLLHHRPLHKDSMIMCTVDDTFCKRIEYKYSSGMYAFDSHFMIIVVHIHTTLNANNSVKS